MFLQPLQPLMPEALQTVRLIATDMDGTLTQHEKFTPALLQALADLERAAIPVLIVTGRSAGWVSAIVHYLPVVGAIAENGGLYYAGDGATNRALTTITNRIEHRQKLAQMFACLQSEFPQIRESSDNLFRITDWTFDVQGLSLEELQQMRDRCREQGWSFVYSTVQCHIKPLQQDKAGSLQTILSQFFPHLTATQVVTVGDSPNDQSLFDSRHFPISVGVANIRDYVDQMAHLPTYVTQNAEAAGFCELARCFLG